MRSPSGEPVRWPRACKTLAEECTKVKKIIGLSVLICLASFAQEKGRGGQPQGGVRDIKVAGGIHRDPFGLCHLGRYGLAAIAHLVAARHRGEVIDRGRRRQGSEAGHAAKPPATSHQPGYPLGPTASEVRLCQDMHIPLRSAHALKFFSETAVI